MSERFDVLIRGTTLYDGTGAPPRVASLGVRGERIARIGAAADARGDVEIEAAGLALAPGFIDVHTHDDFALLLRPEMDFKILGGVTSVIVGNCGLGAAPFPMASLMARTFHPSATLREWNGYAGYLARLDAEPASTNAAVLIGHGTVRASVMANEKRAPSPDELERMKALVREGRDAGAVGLSSGLVYQPGSFASTDELAELAAELRGRGLYATHMRNESLQLLDSVREAIEIGRRAGVPVQISHHKAAGQAAWGLVKESLKLIEQAQADGLDVHADQYPYTAGSTSLLAIVQNGGFVDRPGALGRVAPESVVVATAAGHPEWEGKSIAELARELARTPAAAADHVIAESRGGATAVMHSMSEDDVRTVMRHPSTMIGSDGIPSLPGKPHPRLWGTFARVLGRYARDLGLFPLHEAVYRMTGFAARKFGLRDRGELREGAFADLVVFDAARVIDVGSYEDPNHPPAGIHHVFVNGARVVKDGAHTGARPGRALRRA